MPSGPIRYEVLASVRGELRASWELYMREEHIPEVVVAGGFSGAVLEQDGEGRYRIAYLAPDRPALDRYLRDQAPALRRAALERFPEGVALGRAEWQQLARW